MKEYFVVVSLKNTNELFGYNIWVDTNTVPDVYDFLVRIIKNRNEEFLWYEDPRK